jgi:hypothetical protein
MKQLMLIFCLIPLTSESQTPQEELLGKYEEYSVYEPVFIRENKIASIIIYESETFGDSMMFNREKEVFHFRKDGRPLYTCSWTDSHRDSIWTDFKYDSLGNLIAMQRWKPGLYEKNEETDRIIWKYNAAKLSGVFRYSRARTTDYLSLISCDSVIYSEKGVPVEVWTGGTEGITLCRENPVFIYPVITKKKLELTPGEVVQGKQIYIRDRLRSPCDYRYWTALRKMSEATGWRCIPYVISFRLKMGMAKTIDSAGIIEFVSDRYRDTSLTLDNRNRVRIDTNLRKIRIQTVNIHSQPTSLEDIVTYSRTIIHLDFSFRVLLEEVYQADLGRQYGHSSRQEYKIHETYFQYFDNGLQKQVLQIFESPILHLSRDLKLPPHIRKTTTEITHWE